MVETAAAMFIAMVSGLAVWFCFQVFGAMLDSWDRTVEGWWSRFSMHVQPQQPERSLIQDEIEAYLRKRDGQ